MANLTPKTNALGMRLAAHLLRRTTYMVTPARIKSFATKTPAQAVAELLQTVPAPVVAEPVDPKTGQLWLNTTVEPTTGDYELKRYVTGWWLNEAKRDSTINHKMMLFLHNSFTISFEDTGDSRMLFDYIRLLRFYSLGNLKKLGTKITLDRLMLQYLDNAYNGKRNPNENYAREYFELFTIQKGPQIGPENYTHYTEADIRVAAKLFTGFNYTDKRADRTDPETKLPMGRYNFGNHDTTDKTFSAAFQNKVIKGATSEADMAREMNDFVEMIYGQDATAKSFCRRLYRFLVSRKITAEIENDIITPLAATLKQSNYELKPVLSQLLLSSHFYDEDDTSATDEIIGSLVKSPMELTLEPLNMFNLPIPDPKTQAQLHYDEFYRKSLIDTLFSRANFRLFQPPNVAGYPAYYQEPGFTRIWFTTDTIIARYRLPEMLLSNRRMLSGGNFGTQLFIAPFVKNSGHFTSPANATVLVTEMLQYMLPEMPDQTRFNYFLNEVFLDGLSAKNWEFDWGRYVTSNDDVSVKIPLGYLVTAIMYSPEYQLF